jgi:hypothetical protein
MVSSRSPRILKDTASIGREMDFLAVHVKLSFAGSDTPDKHNIMLFSSAIYSNPACCQSLLVGKTKTPKYSKQDNIARTMRYQNATNFMNKKLKKTNRLTIALFALMRPQPSHSPLPESQVDKLGTAGPWLM